MNRNRYGQACYMSLVARVAALTEGGVLEVGVVQLTARRQSQATLMWFLPLDFIADSCNKAALALFWFRLQKTEIVESYWVSSF